MPSKPFKTIACAYSGIRCYRRRVSKVAEASQRRVILNYERSFLRPVLD